MAELMDERSATDDGIIVDLHLACKLCGITHHHVVAHDAVVSYVAVGHDQAVAAHDGASAGGCATVDCHTLAQSGVVADDGHGVLAAELEILRHGRHDCAWEYAAVLADACSRHDGDIAADAGTLADLHVFLDGDERIYHHAGIDLGGRMYICKRLFHRF